MVLAVSAIVEEFKGDEIYMLQKICERYNLSEAEMQAILDSAVIKVEINETEEPEPEPESSTYRSDKEESESFVQNTENAELKSAPSICTSSRREQPNESEPESKLQDDESPSKLEQHEEGGEETNKPQPKSSNELELEVARLRLEMASIREALEKAEVGRHDTMRVLKSILTSPSKLQDAVRVFQEAHNLHDGANKETQDSIGINIVNGASAADTERYDHTTGGNSSSHTSPLHKRANTVSNDAVNHSTMGGKRSGTMEKSYRRSRSHSPSTARHSNSNSRDTLHSVRDRTPTRTNTGTSSNTASGEKAAVMLNPSGREKAVDRRSMSAGKGFSPYMIGAYVL
jgi:type I site-specific restriction endonuclease